MVSAVDGHASDAEPPSRSDPLAADAALEGGDDEHDGGFHWTREFIGDRKGGTLAEVMIDDVLAAARDAAVDEESVHRALHAMGVRARRDGRLRLRSSAADDASSPVEADPATGEQPGPRKLKASNGDAAAPPTPDESRSERSSNRAPGGKVRIIAVDVDPEGQVDTLEPMSIVVRIRCDEPGQLRARVLVRDGQRAELEAVAAVRAVTDPGLYVLRCDVPADVLGGLKHVVDAEAWLATSGETYASMYAFAQRFRSRERGARRPFVPLDARWSEESL